jgi:hypothetical protein
MNRPPAAQAEMAVTGDAAGKAAHIRLDEFLNGAAAPFHFGDVSRSLFKNL